MNVRTFEIHDVFMVAKKIEVTTAQNIEGQVSNIHNLLIDLYTAIDALANFSKVLPMRTAFCILAKYNVGYTQSIHSTILTRVVASD